MKQTKKSKLPLATQTVRSLTKPLSDDQLEGIAGGTTYTWSLSKCANTTGAVCTQ